MRFITSKGEYQNVYAKNSRREGILFIFLSQKIPEKTFSVGIVVSKKVGIAVIRNKLKRRIKAFLRERPELDAFSQKLVIIAKPAAGSADWQSIKQELTEFLNQ